MQNNHSPLSIRAGTIFDAEAVGSLDAASFRAAILPRFFFVDAPWIFGKQYLVAERDLNILGYLIGYRSHTNVLDGHILSLAVSPIAQGQSVGTQLLEKCISEFKRQGIRRLVLFVSPTNEPALRLYRKLGLSEVSRHQDWFGPGEHRVRMEMQC